MPLDTNLLYGEMVGSWLMHLTIPFGVAMLVGNMGYMEPMMKIGVFIAVCAAISLAVQAGFLAVMQSSSCNGVKDYGSIGTGAVIAALITAAMIAIPAFVEPMRLVVSQLFISHKTLLTPALARMNDILIETGERVLKASLQDQKAAAEAAVPTVQKGGAAISPEQYEKQTFDEIAVAASYWAAFAGAYGVGLGSLIAAKCPATS
jgi:hypothetical protein